MEKKEEKEFINLKFQFAKKNQLQSNLKIRWELSSFAVFTVNKN